MDNLGRVRLGYSGIRTSSGGVTKTQTLKPQTSDPENSVDPSLLSHLNSYHLMFYGRAMCFHLQQPERSEIFYIFSGLSLSRRSNTEKLTRLKIAADNLIVFFTEEIEDECY